MNIYIRTDASIEIGTGHVQRCLVLAEELRKKNVNITFICREWHGNLIEFIQRKGFPVMSLPPINSRNSEQNENITTWMQHNWEKDAYQTMSQMMKQEDIINWLIIDHYGIDSKWERTIKPVVKKIMVIDDLANRPHECDVLLDQNLYRDIDNRYKKLVPTHSILLLGLKYLLIRQEYRNVTCINKRSNHVKRILISFGGSDPTNETMKAIRAIKLISKEDIIVDVLIGHSNPHYSTIKKYCMNIPTINIHFQIDYVAKLMAKADLAIGSGGSTTWERCYMRLPTITIETATNQSEILSYLSEIGVICHIGHRTTVEKEDIAENVLNLMNDPNKMNNMASALKSIMFDVNDHPVIDQLLGGE